MPAEPVATLEELHAQAAQHRADVAQRRKNQARMRKVMLSGHEIEMLVNKLEKIGAREPAENRLLEKLRRSL